MRFGKTKTNGGPDLVCFSHLRWDFVFQRPQHLMSRFARDRRVFFIEEPMVHEGPAEWRLEVVAENVMRCIPFVNDPFIPGTELNVFHWLVDVLAGEWNFREGVLWFYTPMMIDWAAELRPKAVVYDCMDELSAFKNAPPELIDQEERLFAMADLVFTGGRSLYESKRARHPSVHEFPSSVDVDHFRKALSITEEMPEQADLPRPRIGYAGVIDERINLELVADLAEMRPEWTFIMIGPVVKIDPESLPKAPNIHYLGRQEYSLLPNFFAGWDVGMMPFALNEATQFISPTKTPEYLSAGLPVVSTGINDVIRPYGELGLVRIADSPSEFARAVELALGDDKESRLRQVEDFLKDRSWDNTFRSMNALIEETIGREVRAGALAAT